MIRTIRVLAACLLCLGVAITVMMTGCKETGEKVREMGSSFNRGLTEKDRAAITKVLERIQSLTDQFKSDSQAQVKAESVSPELMEKMNSGLDEMDVSTCPDNFRQEFYKYKADFGVASSDFQELAVYSRDHGNDLFGDPKTEINRLRHRFDQAVSQADSDLVELYAIAHKYGV